MIRTLCHSRLWPLPLMVPACCLVLAILTSPICLAGEQEPQIVVRELFDELLSQLDARRDAGTLTHDSVREIFASLLNPRIDYLSLARWILRDYWASASPGQQQAFLEAFQAYIINTYALALADGDKIELLVKDDPLLRKNTAVVSGDFRTEDAEPVPLDFRLIDRDGKWLLFDVTMSGVSLAKTFRSDFTYVANEGGIDAVTTHLVARVASSQ